VPVTWSWPAQPRHPVQNGGNRRYRRGAARVDRSEGTSIAKPLLGHFKKRRHPVKRVRMRHPRCLGRLSPRRFRDAIGVTKGALRSVSSAIISAARPHPRRERMARAAAPSAAASSGTVRAACGCRPHGQVQRTVRTRNIQVRRRQRPAHQGAIPGATGDYVIIRESKKCQRHRQGQAQGSESQAKKPPSKDQP